MRRPGPLKPPEGKVPPNLAALRVVGLLPLCPALGGTGTPRSFAAARLTPRTVLGKDACQMTKDSHTGDRRDRAVPEGSEAQGPGRAPRAPRPPSHPNSLAHSATTTHWWGQELRVQAPRLHSHRVGSSPLQDTLCRAGSTVSPGSGTYLGAPTASPQPSCLQTTEASASVHSRLHTCPHWPPWRTSTTPSH